MHVTRSRRQIPLEGHSCTSKEEEFLEWFSLRRVGNVWGVSGYPPWWEEGEEE